eukprot:GILK01007099.1.p2 GENE.GILK01007099.1~~GILK01007099.1.p2  ORF type:complete len:119 (+),score=9.42 GILK01007099.1:23-379(+)
MDFGISGSRVDTSTPRTNQSSIPAAATTRQAKPTTPMKPTSMTRAKDWSADVEEAFRLQFCGWQSLDEYVTSFGEPERWADTNFISKLRKKQNGFFVYWKKTRECEDKDLRKVKLYSV